MATPVRKLVFRKDPKFTGFACTACGWAKPIPRMDEARSHIESDFANHDCSKYPFKREDSRADSLKNGNR